jgi:tetratricopeptide (TPR) repeat protein
MRLWCAFIALAGVLPAAVFPPGPTASIAKGDSAYLARKASEALTFYLAALAVDSTNSGASWRASRTEVELAEFDADSERTDAMLSSAVNHARSAVKSAPRSARAHFVLAMALGRVAQRIPKEERLPLATEVHTEVTTCLALAPRDAGCRHVLGVWQAEFMRLGTFTREIADRMSGGKLFAGATWEAAERNLRAAIAVEPQRAIHHLDLARIYRDAEKRTEAKSEFEAVLAAPLRDYNDERYKDIARKELQRP